MEIMRILAFDTSLSSPGAAVIEVRNGKPRIIALSHVKTDTKHSHAIRSQTVYAWAHLFIREHMPFDRIVREDFQGRSSVQNYPVFAAWSAIDRALADFGISFTEKPISQSRVKRLVVGKGKAEKDEVAEAVRALTGFRGEFATSDESDAAAVGLAYLINEGLIKRKGSGL
jgi:crossover junction endodeoxyribonuclease RuvC